MEIAQAVLLLYRCPMKTVEIFSDIACPWCYLGKRRFEAALAAWSAANRPQVRWRAYQLLPDYPFGQSEPARPMLEKRFGGAHRLQAAFEQLRVLGKAEEIQFDLDAQMACNTRLAHRGIALAEREGVASKAAEVLFSAFFSEGKDLSKPEVIAACLQKTGVQLETDVLCAALADPSLDRAVEHDLQRAADFGIRGVPFFVADERYALSGAQSVETFRAWLTEAASAPTN